MAIQLRSPTVHGLIDAMQQACRLIGRSDFPIIGGTMLDDSLPIRIVILNQKSEDWQHAGGEAIGLYLEGAPQIVSTRTDYDMGVEHKGSE